MEQQHEGIPAGFQPLETQVAGHTFQADTESIGMLQDSSTGTVLKPLGKPACGERELGFYESLQATKDPLFAELKNFVPKFFDKLKLKINQHELTFLKLEDLTFGMQKPCIMDIKIGQRTWDPLATPQKRAVEEQKYAKCKHALGLCLPGFQVYTAKRGSEVLRHGKDFGKQLDVVSFRAAIALFLNVEPKLYVPLVREILIQLYTIKNWFSKQKLLHFYASSLLLCYDFEQLQLHLAISENKAQINGNGQKENNSSVDTTEVAPAEPAHWIKVKMIDFAHVFKADNNMLDTNYAFGLQSLISIMEDLLER